MTAIDEALIRAERHAATFTGGGMSTNPAAGIAIVTCMDARVDPLAIFGLSIGDAHVIRNAGGVVSSGELRSLAVSQRLLGTTEIAVILHTNCGMRTFTDESFRAELEAEVGLEPRWDPVAFGKPDDDVRRFVGRILADPFLPHKKSVRGFVYDVDNGRLREIT